jgi:hypothetical protein
LFTLPPNQQDLVPGNAATIWVRVRHNWFWFNRNMCLS